ncbi:MAG: hypothetical protein ACE5HB_09180, partial [Terriglobia bacterium]
LVVWRALWKGLWQRYPFFYAYLFYVFLFTVVLVILAQIRFPAYARFYWDTAAVALFLQFFVPWEVFRQCFPANQPIRRVAGWLLLTALVSLTFGLYFGSDGSVFSGQSGAAYPILERKTSLLQAVLLLAALLLARYYAVPLGRNIRAMALGFGLYVSISIANFAAFDLAEAYFPIWRYVYPLNSIAAVAVWAWGLWNYAPNPRPAAITTAQTKHILQEWNQAWSGLRHALKKAMGL